MNPTDGNTHDIPTEVDSLEVVVGDEKQAEFLPRVKIKKWENEANLSIGTTDVGGEVTTVDDQIIYETADTTVRFYPTKPEQPVFDTSYIRLTKLGAIDPHQIGSVYEVVDPTVQSINVHWSNQLALMYYGYYDAESYLNLDKVDIPQMRVAMWGHQNGPMVMDESLKLIDIRYDLKRDNGALISQSIRSAVKNILAPYNLDITDSGNGKMYFTDGDKQVKFYSGAFIGGHYYFYINLGLDYNTSHDYYQDDVNPSTKDVYAYGLRAVADVPDSIVDDILVEYAQLYGLPLQEVPYSPAEQAEIDRLNKVHQQEDWVLHAQRDDVYDPSNSTRGEGFEFEIELKQAPLSNVVPLTVTTKELEFYYQPELTAEERLENHLRQPDIVGSYAAYHVSKRDNQYETGKAFHIYRPFATDANGNKTWCDFDPDWDGNSDLNITVPQEFLDNAAYPVIIDPTFGYDSAGGSAQVSDNLIKGTLQTTPAAPSVGLTLTSISMYIANTAIDGTYFYEGAVYNSAGTSLIAQSTNGVDTAVATWRTLNFANESISASTQYLLCAWGENTGTYPDYSTYYDTSSGTSKSYSQAYSADNWPADISSASTESSRRYSIYVTYAGSYATSFPVFGHTSDGSATTQYNYLAASGAVTWNATYANRAQVLSEPCTISDWNLQIEIAPGAGKSKTWTIYKNGVTTGKAITISDTNLTGSNTTEVTFAAGDTVAIHVVHTNTPAASGDMDWNILFKAENFMVMGSNANTWPTADEATRYLNPYGGYGETYATTSTDFEVIMAGSGGTAKNLYITSTAGPGAGGTGDHVNVTLHKGGSAQALTARLTETAVTANDTTHTVAMAENDLFQLQWDTIGSGSAPTGAVLSWCFSITLTNLGEAPYGFGSSTAASTSAARYEGLYGVGYNAAWNATEADRDNSIGPYPVVKLYGKLTTTPGVGKKYILMLRNAAGTTGLTMDLVDTNVTSDTGFLLPTQFQFQALELTPSGTPAATGGFHGGLLIHIIPPLKANDIALGLTIDNTTITQNHVIQPQDIALGLTTDNTTIEEEAGGDDHTIETQDIALALLEDAATIAQNHIIVTADMALALSEDNATVTETNFNLTVQDIALALTTDNTTIDQTNFVLAVQDILLSLTEDNTTVAETNFILTVQDILLSLTEDSATIAQNHIIASNDIALALTIDNTDVPLNFTIETQDIALALAIDATTISQNHIIVSADIALALATDNTTIDQTNFALTVQDILLSLTEDNATFTQNHLVETQDILLGLTEDNATLTQNHIVLSNDIALGLTIDNATITQNHLIVTADILLSLTEDNTTVEEEGGDDHTLTTQDIALGLTVDSTTIAQNHLIVVSDIALALTIDLASISQNHTLIVSDIALTLGLDLTTIVEIFVLSPQDIAVSLTADNTTLDQIYIMQSQDILITLLTGLARLTYNAENWVDENSGDWHDPDPQTWQESNPQGFANANNTDWYQDNSQDWRL